MNTDQKRIVIARAVYGENYRVQLVARQTAANFRWGESLIPTPDYFNDLNAMHDAEGVLDERQWQDYVRHLRRTTAPGRDHGVQPPGWPLPYDVPSLVGSTAAQRADAFLSVLDANVHP